MSLTLRSTKGSPLTFNEMDGNLTYLEGLAQGGGGPVIPPTAKLYFPDIQGILGDIFYILENDPVSPIDPVFDNFLDPRIINAASIIPVAPQLFLVEGFYRDVLSDPPQFNYNLNIAFNGIVNNEALDSGEEYSATKVTSYLNVDGNGDVIAAGLNELFIDTDISFNYRWEEQMGIYTISLIASNITGSATIAALIEIDSTTGGAGATYDIQVLGTGN